MLIQHFIDEYERYKTLGHKAMAQVADAKLNRIMTPDGNSIAMIVRHISGNLTSRFTDFLTIDGEKVWRDRDAEFVEKDYSRQEVQAMWAQGWAVLDAQLAGLTEADLSRTVYIRAIPLTVHEALCRSLAHLAYHVGQIVLLARLLADADWQSLSIPKGKSQEYNQAPVNEKKPG